jgi:fructokinase
VRKPNKYCTVGLRHAQVLKLNSSEVEPVSKLVGGEAVVTTGQFSADLFAKYPQLNTILVTLGEDGVEAFSSAGEYLTVVQTEVASVVDTIGAGNAFTAGFITGLVAGSKSLEACCRAGNV